MRKSTAIHFHNIAMIQTCSLSALKQLFSTKMKQVNLLPTFIN